MDRIKTGRFRLIVAVLILCCVTASAAAGSEYEVTEDGVITKYLGSDTKVELTARIVRGPILSTFDTWSGSFVTSQQTIETVDRIGANAFSGSGVVEVDLWNNYGIDDNTSVTYLVWKSIGDYAFRDCKKLRRVAIPRTVTEFGVGIFEGCNKQQLTVMVGIGSAAEQYCKDIGVRIEYWPVTHIGRGYWATYRPIDRKTAELTEYLVNSSTFYMTGMTPPDKTLTLFPEVDGYTVVRLCEGAFTDPKHYDRLILPDTLMEIEDRAIVNWPSLREITIPSSVNKIGPHAFEDVGSDQLVFRVAPGSYAERYCKGKGFRINTDL